MGVWKNIDHNQIKIKIPNPSEEPPLSSKAPNQDLRDINVLCTFKIKIERINNMHWCIKDNWTYPNQDQDPKPQSGASSIFQSPKAGLRGQGFTLHLQNQDRGLKIGSWVYQWPVTIPKSRSRCQTLVWNLQNIPKPHIRNKMTWVDQRPLTISESGLKCHTLVRNIQCPQKPKIRTERTWILESWNFKSGSVWSQGLFRGDFSYSKTILSFVDLSSTI